MTRRLVAFLVLAAAGLGCRNTADGAREDARKAAREAEQAAREAKKAAREAKKDLDRAAREAQRAADDARKDVREAMGDARTAMREAQSAVRQASREAGRDAREAAAELNGAKQLVDVRAALAVSKEISSGSDISVSGDEPGRTVILSGTVPTAAEKDAAGRIARASADGLRVENRLKVASR